MMEPTDKKSDDPKWEITNDVIREDDTEWKKRRAVPLLDLKNGNNSTSYFTQFDEGHTRILASLVPDEIIYNIGDYSKREFDGCLLFGDVSGFTDLCEKYNKSGKGGPSRLTQVLNNYIGAMVQEIMSHGGDVLNFSGDAFIALWKVTDHLSMRDAVHEAVDCSLIIQKSYGTYQTDVDVVVRVKLAMASGHLVFSLLGNKESSHYLMTGDPINDIKSAESKSSAGEIVITARVARHLGANEYLLKVFPDGLYAKVLGVGPNWRNIQRQYDDRETYSRFTRDAEDEFSLPSELSIESEVSIQMLSTDDEGIITLVTDQYALRPAVNHAARMKLKDELRRFIIPPVVRGIDASEPLEYLTEIRQVAILFVNCKVSVLVGPVEYINVADNVYLTVYNIVKDNYGCVNKISNFDKDLMLLIIFGLRGFKHELESQKALKCATECFEKIKSIEQITDVAVAVTTGRCYCGAFGHTLRREYTVIGLVVNKAARLMIAYPNRVTCDRDSFLYSKLESSNFLLQEYKPLKGIVNPGPVYEFKEVERTHDPRFSISPFPLLGREQQIDLYNTLMSRAKEMFRNVEDIGPFFNMLIIRGDFRQGKTRLCEEIMFSTDSSLPIHTFTLTPEDRDIPFRTIQLIFLKFIGMPGSSSRTSRERRIKVRLEDRDVDEFYFVFNRVFDLRFPITTDLESDEKILELLSKMFALLCTVCFTQFWIIAIDDGDYIDDESWMLIQILLDIRLVFMLITMSTQKELTSYALQVLKNEHMKIIELKPIDKWYHGGLICQMLNIEGIPPELERTVHNRSNGNPGWIESFLVTLMQSGGITFSEIKRIAAHDIGIVMPPPYMLTRLAKEEANLWMDVMEERTFSKKDEEASKRWKIFVDSCRESYPDIKVSKLLECDISKDQFIKVCQLSPTSNLEDVAPAQHIDVVILQTFDSLTSYEQLLLKCSAVLGDIFPRDMLLYIMSSTISRLTALAVQKLFEIQVLSCARGNFLDGGLNFKDRLVDPNDDLTVKCECTGLVIDDICIDLPKYASCGFLRFRSSEFRETTYNLLTDNQKREFHGKAIRYMEKETRRCRSCGSGYFTRYLGNGRLDDGLRTRTNFKSKKYSLTVSQESFDTLVEKASFGRTSSATSWSKSHSSNFKFRDMNHRGSNLSGSDSISLGPTSIFEMSGLGIGTIKKLKDNYNLVRTFSSYDYSQCTCIQILNTMYAQLIEHCKGAGLVEKIMMATIEYSYVCIDTKNVPQAIKILEEALELLEGPMKDQLELDWMVSLKRGKLYTLLGRARLCLEDDIEAYNYLIAALNCYGIKFPRTGIERSLLKYRLKLKQMLRLFIFSSMLNRRFDEDLAEYCNNVSECLHLLCTYFCNKRQWKAAELAATWSLNKAIETESDFEILCLAYSSMIYITSLTKQHRFSIALEVFALRTCHRKKTAVEIEELKAVTQLYVQIGRSRFLRGDIEKAMYLCLPTWRIANAAQSNQLLIRTFPMLACEALMRKQLLEFGNIIAEFTYMFNQYMDSSEMMWYYSLCFALHLETGFIVQSLEKCNQYLQRESLNDNLKDPTGRIRLIIIKWLWEVRNENWEIASIWEDYAWNFTIINKGENIHNLITALYLIEGLIIYMVSKIDTKDFKASYKADKLICLLFKKLGKASNAFSILQPRLYHMKAYYILAKYDKLKTASKYLKKAQKIAEKQHNDLELDWIKHSELAWNDKLPTEEAFVWHERCEEANYILLNDADYSDKISRYTLPLPLYI